MNKTFVWLGGGALALYFLSKFSLSKKINFLLQGVETGGTVLSPSIRLIIGVQNPTNQKAIFKSLSGSLYLDGKYFANVSSFGDQVINPNSETTITITAKPSAIGIFSAIKDLIQTKGENLSANITGSANIDGINYPLDISKTL